MYFSVEEGRRSRAKAGPGGTKEESCRLYDDWLSSAVQLFNSSASISPFYWNLTICLGVFISFMPLISPSFSAEISIFDFPQLTYKPYVLALTLNVAFAVPMLTDALLDCFDGVQKYGSEVIRALLAIAYMVPALLIILLCLDEESPDFRLFHSIVMCHLVVQYCLLYQLLNSHDREVWTDLRITVMTILHVITICSWTASMWLDKPALGAVSLCTFVLNNLLGLGILLFIWFPKYWRIVQSAVGRYDAATKSNRFSWFTKYIFGLQSSIYSHMTPDESISIFYVATLCVICLTTAIGQNSLLGYMTGTYAISFFLILLTVYPGRVARQIAKESSAALESKKAFVQYISHEARGPLSVASMGLELHLGDLQRAMSAQEDLLRDPRTRDEWLSQRCVSVNEIVDSCLVAQNTLNDLLTYDKIESGMLKVEKAMMAVFPFVQKELSPFSIQSRYKNITVNYNWSSGQVHPSYDQMCVFADKHKIAQVFRNLLSNALKFTPENGVIDVNVQILCLLEMSEPPVEDYPLLLWNQARSDRSIEVSSSNHSAPALDSSPAVDAPIAGRSHSPSSAASVGAVYYSDITAVDFATVQGSIADLVCRVEVEDSGPGISEENMSKLFGKYVQFNAAEMQQGGGSGLGLWRKLLTVHMVFCLHELHPSDV
jgi:signal transduction histidine kinase